MNHHPPAKHLLILKEIQTIKTKRHGNNDGDLSNTKRYNCV